MPTKVLFFDFVDTIADVSAVPRESLKAYAQKCRAIAEGREAFSKPEFDGKWIGAHIPSVACDALVQLRRMVQIVVLTNSPLAFVTEISRRSAVEWDAILCAEMFKQCKPSPTVYRGACELMRVEPSEAVMVAAHPFDVAGAEACGLKGFLLGNGGLLSDLAQHLSNGF